MKRGLIFLIFIALINLAYAFCGDGVIDPDNTETCKTCPQDNPCFVDKRCIQGKCINKLIPPLLIREDPGATVIIPREIAETLNRFLKQPDEFAACLKGQYADGVYQITTIEFPEMTGQSIYAVEHAKCLGINVIATIHSHLDGSCELSKRDIFSFGHKGEPLTAIICGENDFAFYSKLSFTKRMNYLIRDIEYTRLKYFWSLFPWVFSLLLIIILLVLFFEREHMHKKRKKEKAIEVIEKCTSPEKKIINTLLDEGYIHKGELKKNVFESLIKEDIIERKQNRVILKKWFRKAIKKL